VAGELGRCRATLAGPPREQVTGMLADPEGTREMLAGLIEQAWHLLIASSWGAIEALLDADVAYQSRQLANSGLRRVIDGLHEKVSMDEHGVHVADRFAATVSLAGRGLVLMPSAFVWPGIAVVTDEPWQPTIAYPARGIAGLWERPPPAPEALVTLLGRTRATLLASLDRPASTTALAGRHEMSPAGASRHLIALRDAGLVTGSRHGHEVRYSRTRLGTELIRSASGPLP
jgi:DNA-binding transcriptional ArsR family regulator